MNFLQHKRIELIDDALDKIYRSIYIFLILASTFPCSTPHNVHQNCYKSLAADPFFGWLFYQNSSTAKQITSNLSSSHHSERRVNAWQQTDWFWDVQITECYHCTVRVSVRCVGHSKSHGCACCDFWFHSIIPIIESPHKRSTILDGFCNVLCQRVCVRHGHIKKTWYK